MSDPFALRVTVELGDRRRTLGPGELAAALGMPGLPGRLAALVLGSPESTAIHRDIHNSPVGLRGEGEPTEGKGRPQVPTGPDVYGSGNDDELDSFSDSLTPEGVEASGGRCRREAKGEGAIDAAVDRIAVDLASAFADEKSLPLYRRVADEVPLRTVRWALGIVLELGPDRIRRSRASYFTALVRPHMRPRRARTNPST